MALKTRPCTKVFHSSLIFLMVYVIAALAIRNCSVVMDDDYYEERDEEESSTQAMNGSEYNQTKRERQSGPYRVSHIENNRIFLAGILGLKGASRLARGGVGPEVETIFENMKNLLQGYDDTSLEKVIWIKFLLVNMSESAVVENAFYKYFKPPYPNKTIEPVERLKFNARVEAELFASLNWTKKMDVELY